MPWPRSKFGQDKLLGEQDFGNGYALLTYPGYFRLVRTKDRSLVGTFDVPGSPVRPRPTFSEMVDTQFKVSLAMGEDVASRPFTPEEKAALMEMATEETRSQESRRAIKEEHEVRGT